MGINDNPLVYSVLCSPILTFVLLCPFVLQAKEDNELVQSILDALHHHRVQHGVAIASTLAALVVPSISSAFEQADHGLKPKVKRSLSQRYTLRRSPRPSPRPSPKNSPHLPSRSVADKLDLEVPRHVKKSRKRRVLHLH